MPEGDTIYRAARTLNRALAGQTVTEFESVLPKLSRVDCDKGIVGRIVQQVESQGKWLLMRFSGDLVLLTHMLMSGSWHIYRRKEKWRLPRYRMRIVMATQQITAVAFDLQIAEFHTPDSLIRRRGFATLGPSLLSDDFNSETAAVRLMEDTGLEVGEALLKQSVLAGIGNVFKSEVCFAAGVHPFRKMSSLTKEEASNLVAIARKYLQANVTDTSDNQIVTYGGLRRTTSRSNPHERLWVYKRAGEPCRRCGSPIESRKQGCDARITFWCSECQKLDAVEGTKRAS